MKYFICLLLAFFYLNLSAQTIGSTIPNSGGAIADSSQTSTFSTIYEGIWLPPEYNQAAYKDSLFPVIFSWHGNGQGYGSGPSVASLSNLLTDGLPKLLAAGQTLTYTNPADGKPYHFIVIAPQTQTGTLYGFDIWQIYLSALHKYRIDPNRVYEMGYSYGGYAVWSSFTDDTLLAKRIAAAAPMSAEGVNNSVNAISYLPNPCYCWPSSAYKWNPSLQLANIAKWHTAIWEIDNPNDQFYGQMKNYQDSIVKYGGNVITSWMVGNGHNSWVYADAPTFTDPASGGLSVYQWFLTHTLSGNQGTVVTAPPGGGTDTTTTPPPVVTPTVNITVANGPTLPHGTVVTITYNGTVIATVTTP